MVAIHNLIFESSSKILAEKLSKCNQHQRTACWKMTTACGRRIFLRVCSMCLSHIWQYLFSHWVHRGTWALDGCYNHIICITNWFIQISLEFRKMLVYKVFILKDTNLLVCLPRPYRKQSTIFFSSNSNLVFLTCSFLFAKTDALLCVNLVPWKELNKCFLYFFLKSLFFVMLGILSTRLFWRLKLTAFCKKSKSWPRLAKNLPLTRFL